MTDKIVVPLLITQGETQVYTCSTVCGTFLGIFFNITSFPVENNQNPKLIMTIVFFFYPL